MVLVGKESPEEHGESESESEFDYSSLQVISVSKAQAAFRFCKSTWNDL